MNKYDKFNDMEFDLNEMNITPEDRDKYSLDDIEKRRILNMTKKSKKSYKKTYIGIAAAFVIMAFAGFTNPGREVLAKAKEFVLETFNIRQEEVLDSKVDLEQYVQNVDEMVYGDDYKIKFKSFMLHGNNLMITSLIEFDKEQNDDYYIQIYNIPLHN